MDEMTVLRELRADTPPITSESAQAARRRLLAGAADLGAERERPSRLGPRRLGAAGVLVAAAAAVAVAVAATGGTGGGEGGTPQPRRLAPVATVEDLGARAARAAESGPAAGPDQWIYVKGSIAASADDRPGVTDRRTVTERWVDYGKPYRYAVYADGKLRVTTMRGSSSLNVGRYSTDPDVLLGQLQATARKRRPPHGDGVRSPQEEVFAVIRSLMAQTAPPPKLQAALYRVLPRIEGVTLRKDAVDAAGRHGVAFAMAADSGRRREEIVLDRATYRYLGMRSVAVRSFTVPNGPPRAGNPDTRVPAGTVLSLTAQLAQGIVDEPGQRP